MLKNNFFSSRLFWLLCLMLGIQLGHAQTRSYRTSSTNLVRNSTFQGNTQSATVPDWTFDPVGDASRGWRKENSLIYGEYIAIDRVGSFTATPALSATPCPTSPKVVKFFFNEENTGPYTFTVRLGTQVIATFTNNGLAAQSNFELGTGISGIVDRKFISEGLVNETFIWNNIWHEVELYVPNYTGGNLTFEYTRTGGISRKVRLDNVELYEAIPTPVPTNTNVNLANCTATTYNLTTLQPSNSNYTYTWYTRPNPIAANQVTTPTAAPLGTYYLYASPATTCANNTVSTQSLPSAAVTVNGATGCCGSNVIRDFGFDLTDPSDSPTGFLVPRGDNANNGGINWRRNFTNNDDQLHIGNYLVLNTALAMQPVALGDSFNRAVYQQNSSICQTGGKIIRFKFAINTQYGLTLNDGPFEIYLQPSVANLQQSNPFNAANLIARFYYDGNAYSRNGANIAAEKWVVDPPANGVSIRINNVAPVTSGASLTRYNYQQVYDVEITVPETFSGAFGGIGFLGALRVGWLIDNVEVVVLPPTAQSPTASTGSINCTTGVFDLNSVTPTTAGYVFEWYSDAAGTIRVQNPATATAGTYYLKTISACSGCSSTTLTSFNVQNNCARVSGKIYSDFDGTATNGVSNPTGLGMSAGMFAHLVNSSNQIVNSVKVNSDGTYLINSVAGTGYRVLITNTQLANGTAAPATGTLNPNYFYTSSSSVGTANPANIATGYSPAFNLTAASVTSGVNFGINAAPIASDAKGEECAREAGTVYQMPTLYGVDDNPNFNNGVGQTVYMKTLSQTGGTLQYNGVNVTANSTLTNYDPTLLTFTLSTSGEAAVNFTYTFIDAAGAESQEAGVVSYSFVPKPVITGGSIVAVGSTLNQVASITPGTWSSTDETIATVNADTGLITGVQAGTVTITYTSYIGCSTTRTIEVTAAACVRPGVVDAANTYPSLTGVTHLDKTVENNWPNNRQSAHLVIESNSRGFVINRVATPESTITDPKEGMMVYDTTANCFKVNTTGTSNGWKCLTTPTCPTN